MFNKTQLKEFISLLLGKISSALNHLLKEKNPIIPIENKRSIYLQDGPRNFFVYFTYYIGESPIKCSEPKCGGFVEDPPLKKILIEIKDIYVANSLLNKDRSHYSNLRNQITGELEKEYKAEQLSLILGAFCDLHLSGFLKKYPLGLGTKEPIASNVPGSEDEMED
ncbi:hypothetical protein HY061_02695 [Candidatus Azambacteria bacterium]|nr:hypothetical protein [Candidatus Azambacteria bacterium]